MSYMRHGQQLHPDELETGLGGIEWADYAAIMRAVSRDPGTPDPDERLRLAYVLMDLAERAGLNTA